MPAGYTKNSGDDSTPWHDISVKADAASSFATIHEENFNVFREAKDLLLYEN